MQDKLLQERHLLKLLDSTSLMEPSSRWQGIKSISDSDGNASSVWTFEEPNTCRITEVAESSRQVLDDSSSIMDMLSLNFLTLELQETAKEEIPDNDFMHQEIDENIILPHVNVTLVENVSLKSNERKRTRRKINENPDGLITICNNSRSLKIISLDELLWHDRTDDCWIAIYDYVYDCTEFVGSHPGGRDVILEYAGRDATIAFIGTGHSNNASKILGKYLIGELPANERLFRKNDGVKIVEL